MLKRKISYQEECFDGKSVKGHPYLIFFLDPNQYIKVVFSATRLRLIPQSLLHHTIQELIHLSSNPFDFSMVPSQSVNPCKPRNKILYVKPTEHLKELLQHLSKLPPTLPLTIRLPKRHPTHHIIGKPHKQITQIHHLLQYIS
ncbi:hypothetical protein HanXRQr2_Chr09g0411201 [Helianthus annuus]|uniref:Uncharacterized protein n=1 Tax=Helianthus annuus TaxID=4232 RepID=A0A9K3IA39_HELAN|nr:hypothetical protein HanXRQr2_Chr09g0411201 [Helianthus annuus]KAJ0895166.1 hypothetical protein HanPSC8_Chr09g0397301 [Helianthus annuus]